MSIYLESSKKLLGSFKLGTDMFIMYIYEKITVYVMRRLA